MRSNACLHAAIGRHAKTTAHPGFAKRLTGGGSAAGFIAAAKRRETFKAAAESGGAHADGKPRKRGRRSVNGKDGNSKDGKGARQRLPRNPQESTCTRWKTAVFSGFLRQSQAELTTRTCTASAYSDVEC